MMELLSISLARLLELAWHLAPAPWSPAASLPGLDLYWLVDTLTRRDDGEPSPKAVHIGSRNRMLRIGQKRNFGIKVLRYWISAADGYRTTRARDTSMITRRISAPRKM
jgi:hypothetical protein